MGNREDVMSMLDKSIDSKSLAIMSETYSSNSSNDNSDYSCWGYWRDRYYPEVIHPSYPIYIKERAEDKGKQAFEIIKKLSDKKMINLKTVKNFIDAMDLLIKIL